MNQKGFTNMVLAGVVIFIAIVGLAGYLLWVNKSKTAVPPVLNQTADWKTYRNERYEFEYPAIISLKQDGENITLSHSIAYKHDNSCDFKGDAPALEKLLDFNVSLTTFSGGLKDAIQSNEGSDYVVKNFFENNTLKLTEGFINTFNAGTLRGFQIESGVEGCGRYTYYFPISATKTLVVNRLFVPEFSPVNEEYQIHLNLPGIISPNQEKEFFTKILSTFKFIENNAGNSAVNITDFLGYWFTPHAATRNITFLKNNQFKFSDGKNPIGTGNFIINAFTVTLKFDNNKMKDIILKLSQDNSAKYLQNDEGEYFVKQ